MVEVIIIFLVGFGCYYLGWRAGKEVNYNELLCKIDGFTTRAENNLRTTIQYCEDAEENAKKLIQLTRHWALVAKVPRESVIDTENWTEGEIKRRRDG